MLLTLKEINLKYLCTLYAFLKILDKLLSFPCALILNQIKHKILRKIFTSFVGLFFMFYLGSSWMPLVLITTSIIYLLHHLRSPFVPICIISFSVLGYLHYDRYMVLFLKNNYSMLINRGKWDSM